MHPKETREKFRGEVDKAADDDLDDWLDMQIIAARSAEVSKLIYYPFITLSERRPTIINPTVEPPKPLVLDIDLRITHIDVTVRVREAVV